MSSCLEGAGCALCFLMSGLSVLRNNFPLLRVYFSCSLPLISVWVGKRASVTFCEPGSASGNLPSLPLSSHGLSSHILWNSLDFLFQWAKKHKKWQKFSTENVFILLAGRISLFQKDKKTKKEIVVVGLREQIRKAWSNTGKILLLGAIYPSEQTFESDHGMLVISYGCWGCKMKKNWTEQG